MEKQRSDNGIRNNIRIENMYENITLIWNTEESVIIYQRNKYITCVMCITTVFIKVVLVRFYTHILLKTMKIII